MAADREMDTNIDGAEVDEPIAQPSDETNTKDEVTGDRTTEDSEAVSDEDIPMGDGNEEDEDADSSEESSIDELQRESPKEASSESSSDSEDNEDSGKEESADEKSEEAESDSESEEEEDRAMKIEGTVTDTEAETQSCILCGQSTKENNASTEVLICVKCDNCAHRACAIEKEVWKEEDGEDQWQCQDCSIIATSESPNERKKNKAPRLVRDLLPVSRGIQKPNSHSIFNQPLIAEGEDGGRSLRKRKSPTTEPAPSEKRRRRATPKALSVADEAEAATPTTRRASMKAGPIARVLQYRPPNKPPPHKFILAFRLNQSSIEKVLSKPSRPGRRRRDRRRPPKIPPPPIYQPPVPKFPALPTSHLIFPSMWGDRENEINAKPYGGILSDPEADTSRSLPQLRDRELFEIARKEAEEERRKTSAAAEAEINGDSNAAAKPSRTVSGPPSKIKCIQFGKYVIDTFYAAPYPEEYSHESRLFICEFCLKYLPSEFVAFRHKLKCPVKHPPGDEIYRDGSISVWEVDGRKRTEYCQCLCLMAKMFLGSKTLYYDVEPFLFYILTEYDEFGYHFVGYFSKEKRPASQNNVSCILVMPIHQRKGYATFLIDFSYLLTRIEGKDGSPEKPLSDMGLTAYRSYWDLTISRHLLANGSKPISTKDLMQQTGMTADDVIHSLERLYAFVRDPVTKAYALRYDKQLYENIVTEFESKKHRELRAGHLVWTPYIMGRSDQAHLDGQPMQAIAPREGDDVAVADPEDLQTEKPGHQSSLGADGEPLSPRSTRITPKEQQVPSATDPLLVNGSGHVAPGPPTTEALTGVPVPNEEQPQVNGSTDNEVPHATDLSGQLLTGYALTYQTEDIPPTRFQIDPPIPPSMLRNRQNKRKLPLQIRADGTSVPNSPVAVRSSPRHGTSVSGSINGADVSNTEKPLTPLRRSNRKSGLISMETANTDGSMDEDDEDVLALADDRLKDHNQLPEEEESTTTSSSEEEEDIAVESTSDEEDSDADGNTASSEDEDEDDQSVAEEEEEEDEEDDPEVEIEEDEEDDEDDDEA